MADRKRSCTILKSVGLLVVAGGVGAGWLYGPAMLDFYRAGFFDEALNPRQLREYQGNSIDNLRAMHLALSLYHESEGQFPHGEGWMDALEPYIRTDDMSAEEAQKKFMNPLLGKNEDGAFGYAFNDAASAKYKDDVPTPARTPLVFDSSNLSRNAHGSPEELLPNPPRQGGNMGISVTGEVLKL